MTSLTRRPPCLAAAALLPVAPVLRAVAPRSPAASLTEAQTAGPFFKDQHTPLRASPGRGWDRRRRALAVTGQVLVRRGCAPVRKTRCLDFLARVNEGRGSTTNAGFPLHAAHQFTDAQGRLNRLATIVPAE